MKEFKGTKGPWVCSKPMNFSGAVVCFIESAPIEKSVAQLRGCETGQEAEAGANAKLIAAAPELLHSCNELIELLSFHGYNNSTEISEAKQAINKALGNE